MITTQDKTRAAAAILSALRQKSANWMHQGGWFFLPTQSSEGLDGELTNFYNPEEKRAIIAIMCEQPNGRKTIQTFACIEAFELDSLCAQEGIASETL